ncbi:TPR domain protein, putative component of TonB system [Labilithrix luteola]|uniref:TPR domain protein, putative component of TonB system n=1 Tax=Labilithrix luteola TaxID=1391654 RepID=A0A0K1Q2F6_9BACT|nr:tetratricopeptide repeat protein [Labilithrix luteola]AKU99995.1 TPR domain protein, putative component of TonB system [Labilithrix luteola]
MDLQERLKQLENVRDWQGLVEELEKGIQSAGANEAKASFHLRLGQVLEQKFLSGVKALKHFQDAYKLNPALSESLEAARGVYWSLGKLNMVQKLLELELRTIKDGPQASALLLELGDVLSDLGDYDKATSTYARALATSGGQSADARGCLEDVQAESGSWQTHVQQLVRAASEAESGEGRSRLYLRAARIARRFAPDDVQDLLERAYSADPSNKQNAALYEGALAELGKLDHLEALQSRLLEGEGDIKARARLAHTFGARWASRHQNVDIGSKFLEESIRLDPENEGAFHYLRDAYGRKGGDWDRVLTLAEEAVTKSDGNGNATFLLAQAGTIAWRQLGNLIRARTVFARLSQIDPEHPQLLAFEAQIGESLSNPPPALPTAPPPTINNTSPPPRDFDPRRASVPDTETTSPPPAVMSEEPATPVEPEPVTAQRPASAPPPSAAAAAPAAASSPSASDEEGDPSKIAELRALADKQEANKRYNEYVKTLLQLAAIVPDAVEKVELYTKAAELYTGKFANQAEAVKAYEQVIAIDPENRGAIDYLRQMYEKRRDWEKLLGLERKEAERLYGDERARKFLEIAKLATERVKKPEVCIELWAQVLDSDPSNAEALGALGGLYERSKEFDKLVEVLEKQAEVTYDNAAKIQILTKLGTIYGDRLNNDEGAVNAWRQLLALDPNDRKAQEAVKKKYLALGRWDDLEVFYAESGKWDEFIRVLEQQEAKETAADAKISLLFKIAELWADKKQKNDRAARAYEKVLELEATSLRAAEALIPIYSAAGNSKALANAIEVKLGHEEDAYAKLALLREVAALYEGKVKEPQKAFARYLSAFSLAPSDEQTTIDVERAAKATGEWAQVEAAYKNAVEQATDAGDASLAITLRLKLGRVLVEEMNQVDEALAVYRAVYDADSENADALAALERLYRATSRYADLLGIYEKRRELSPDQGEKKQISYEIAKLYETELKDLDRAIDTYNGVLEDEPTDSRALAALDVLYRQLERWEPYVDTLRRRIELDATEQELIDLKFRLGQTLEKHTGDAAGALENYREILFLNAQHDGAREALEALLANESLRGEAAAILENIYEERGDWSKLLTALDILSEAEGDSDKRVALLRKIARFSSEMLNDHARAFKALASALREQPHHEQTRAEIERIAEISTTWKALTELYEQIAEGLTDAQLARSFWMRSAMIEDQQLGLVDEAASGYVHVLSLDPADSEALDALEALFVRTQRWTDLIGVTERRIEQTADPERREALYVQMARIYDEQLARPDDAVASYKRVLELDPASQTALSALDALFTRQRMWSDLAENLEAQLALATEDEAQIALMLRLAALRESEMNQIEQAIDGYRSVLERDVSNAQALAALERLGRDAAYELVIADLLEPLYRQIGDYQKLIGAHEVQVRRADDAARRVDLLHQIAQLHEDAAADLNSAFATLARALKEDPANDVTQQQIDRVARATSRFDDLAQVYRQLASEIEDAQLASSLFMISARVYEADIGDVDTAIALYRRVLEIDATLLAAATSLERLFRQTERYQDLSQILQRKAEILDEPGDKKDALFQAAAIEEDVLEKPEAAIAVYKKVLEIDEDELRALDALIKRYLGLSRWADLLAVYSKKADLVADPDEKKRIYYQVGAVFERELGDVTSAIDTYQKILELDPDDLQALSRLDVLYEQAQNWQELLGVLTRESEMCDDPNESISFQYRIAELYERRLDDVTRAIELYREILQRQVDHEPTLTALEGLKSGEKDPLGAAAVLEPVYEAASDWPRLISVHEVQVRHASDPFQQVDLLHRIARLYEDALESHGNAFDTYARALTLDNGNEATLQNLERLAMVVNRWPQVASLYDVELDKLTETPDRFVELGLRLAQIFEVQLEDVDNAIIRHRKVTEVEPENQNAVRSLDRLYLQTERWPELAAILEREAEIGQTPDEILEFKYRLGEVQQHRLNNLDAAIAAYRDVLNAAPEHRSTLEALEGLFAAGTKQVEIAEILEPLYRAAGEWEKLAGVYEAQLAHTQGQEERLQAYYRIAELFEEKLIDPVQTLNVYIRALKEFPLDEKAAEEAPRLASGIDGGWETLANAYADILSLHQDANVQRVIGRRLAKTFEDELGDIDKAVETYRYVLSVEALDPEALANLDRIYLSIEAWADLAGVLEMRVKAPTDDLELVELYARLGEVYETRLGDIPNATIAFRKIFDGLDKTHDGAVQALARIYAGQGAWVELNTVYERELENASGDVAEAEIRARIANLASERLNDPIRAIDTWKVVLDLRGEDPEALAALSNLYESQQAWRELVDILERQFDIAGSDDDRVNILTRRARTFESRLQRDDLALDDWNRVLDIDYANLAALRAIAAIRRRQQEPQELVSALHQMVDRAAAMFDPEELKEIFRELGKVYGSELQQPYDAADAWRKLLEVGPDFEAMDALEGIYRAQEQWTDVIDVKMQRAAALEDSATKIEEYRQVAELWRETVQDPDKATPAWQRILEADVAHDEAFHQLEKLHTAASRWEPVVELYLGRLDTREETAEKTDLLRRIARVFEEKLEDKNQALDALINALGEDFHDRDTAKYLERMAQATGRWGEVIQTANNWLQQQTEAHQKIRLCLHLAKWYGDDLGHPEYAQPYYAQIVSLDPNNVGALRQMGQLYRKNGNWQQLGATLTRALDVAVADVDRKEIQTELGELLDSQMNQTDQAISYFQRALEVDPLFIPAIENLERIYASRGQNKELVDILGRKVPALTEPSDIAATKLRIGALNEQMSDPQRAAQTYREVVEIEPQNIQGLRGLARVYQQLEQWPELVRVLEAQLDVVTTERERIDILMQLANIHEEHFRKPDIAAARLEQVLEIDPNHEEAYFALERCYRKLRQWPELINVYERHISATLDRKTKTELYGAIAQVYADEIEDTERAIDAYRNIVDLDDTNLPALEALSKLYDKVNDASQSIDYMTRVAELTQDTKQRVESFYKIGKALDEKLGDRVAAQDRYEMALDLDPSHLATLGALRQIAIDNADYDKAARYIDQEQSYTPAPRQRARLLVELGRLREEMLGDHDSAVLAWEAAHEADPENEDAAMPLVDEYIVKEAWERGEPLLDMLTRKAGKRDRGEQHTLWNKLGMVTAKLAKDDKSFKAYSAAHQLDLTDQTTIRGLAEVCFRLKDWGAALTNFQKVLTSLGEDENAERAEVYFKLGCIKREQGQAKQAINNFEKALGVDNTHRPTLEALVGIYSDLKDWKQVVAYKRQILDNVFDGEERFKVLLEIGDIWNDQDKSPARAIEALEEAKELQPDNRPLLHKMLSLYETVRTWDRVVETIQAIADMEKEPLRKYKFIYAMAQIYRDPDKLNDVDRAVELFNEALDLNPTYLEAFERINKILTAQKDWKALERAFRKMLRRLSTANAENKDLEFNLWHNLGLIYRDRLGDVNSAIEAFKMATRYKPDEPVERQILAELYENTEQLEAAIGEHSIVLQKDPLRVDPYRSLYKLALKMHDYDRAWCMCSALAFLHKADEEEQRFFEDYRPRGMIQVKSRLDNEQWVKNLFHKDENIFIGKIFEMVTPAAIVAKTQALAKAKQLPALDRRFKQEPATSTVTFAKTFGWAAQVLGIQLPELYVRNDVPGALVAVPSRPPASVAGQSVLTGYTPQELTFIVGKHLSYYRGEHYIKNLFPTLGELKVVFFSAIKIIQPDFNVPPEMAQAVNMTAEEFKKYMQPVERDSLRLVVQKFIEDGAKADLKRWMQAVDVSAARAGLLLCADLEIAKKIIAAEPQLPGDLSPPEKLKELIVFSVSEQYLALRKALGIAIG